MMCNSNTDKESETIKSKRKRFQITKLLDGPLEPLSKNLLRMLFEIFNPTNKRAKQIQIHQMIFPFSLYSYNASTGNMFLAIG